MEEFRAKMEEAGSCASAWLAGEGDRSWSDCIRSFKRLENQAQRLGEVGVLSETDADRYHRFFTRWKKPGFYRTGKMCPWNRWKSSCSWPGRMTFGKRAHPMTTLLRLWEKTSAGF